jgi:hypothetical protein
MEGEYPRHILYVTGPYVTKNICLSIRLHNILPRFAQLNSGHLCYHVL